MLDVRTLIFTSIIIQLMSLITFIVLYVNHRRHYNGMLHGVFGISFLTMGFILILLRDKYNSHYLIFLSNFLVTIASLKLFQSLSHFFNHPKRRPVNYLVVLIVTLLMVYFTWFIDNVNYRAIVMSLFSAFLFSHLAYFLHFQVETKYARSASYVKLVSLAFVIINIIRVFVTFFDPTNENNFENVSMTSFFVLSHVILNIILVLSMILMVNKRLQSEVDREKDRFIKTFIFAPNAMLLIKAKDKQIYDINRSFEVIFKQTRDSVINQSLSTMTNSIPVLIAQYYDEILDGNLIYQKEVSISFKDGDTMECLFSAGLLEIYGEDYLLIHFTDITEMSKLKAGLEFLANHDPLTNLPNRRFLRKKFDLYVKEKKSFGVLLCDLNDFKHINDIYGHDFGDKILVFLARQFQTKLNNCFTSRFGGDEFLILHDSNLTENLVDTVKRIETITNEPIKINGQLVNITASIGYAVYPDDGLTIEELTRKSDLILYKDKTKKQKKT